jgi:hypothetical protein
MIRISVVAAISVLSLAFAQDPTASLEGTVSDPSGGAIAGAVAEAVNVRTAVARSQVTDRRGSFAFPWLPVGEYELRVSAPEFAPFTRKPIELAIQTTVRLQVTMQLASRSDAVLVTAEAPVVDPASNVLGTVVSGREIVDLPLNGRNFTQLGLLQAGVAPLTAGVSTAGGSLRSGHAYAVNGQRPESNVYVLDGARNVNRMDGGYALKPPVDAISEFRILTHSAPAEYGGASGGVTSVVTRSGGNELHGSAYEFLRNDRLDARNFFSDRVEPLKQNQFGATLGGPIVRNRAFFFAWYEGFRNRQGVTKTAAVPTEDQRRGDFSGQPAPLINYLTGQMVPGSRIPESLIHPVSRRILEFYPAGNRTPSLFSSTEIMTNNSDQGGARLDHTFSESDHLSGRYAYSTGFNINPLSIKGADVPGFPVGDDLTTQSLALSETHLFSGRTTNSFRASVFRHRFLFDKRLNRTAPRSFGFNYDSTLDVAQGPPFFIVNGYASVGDPITGPRNTVQNTYEVQDALSLVRGAHTLRVGGEFRRQQINAVQGIASNGFFVFAPFPTSDPFANLLLGRPVVFFQAGGDMNRGLRSYDVGGFVQDEWRITRRLTANLGLRYEVIAPFTEIRDRMNAFAPGQQSRVRPDAPAGLLFPGDEGVPRGIAEVYRKGWMPRLGLAWDPAGTGITVLRASYAIFFDGFTNGASAPFQAPLSALPWTQANQLPGPALRDFSDPYNGGPAPFGSLSFPRPMTALTIEQGMRPPYAQDWNFSVQRSLAGDYLVEMRYVGTKGTRLPRFIEGNPAVFGPGASAQNADQRRLYAGCNAGPGPCTFASAGLLVGATSSTYHAGQWTFSRRFRNGAGFSVSYWFSKTLDYVSSLNLSGSAPRLLSGENDLPQNPFDWRSEHGPSLFDARHRWVASGSWRVPSPRSAGSLVRALAGGWQLNCIATVSSGTPFTVYDSANVSLQGSHPEISGFFSSRPDVVADPNRGPRTADQWVSPSAFRRLDPIAEAGRFGNAGRNTARGPGIANLDLSLLKNVRLAEPAELQFRAECFNVANHANLGLPVNDVASANFGRVLESGPPRLFQFGLKVLF